MKRVHNNETKAFLYYTIALYTVFIVFIILLVTSCGLVPTPVTRHGGQPEKPLVAPFQPFRIIQLCLDTPPLFPARLSHEASSALADRIDSAVTVNFGGLQVYVSYITSHSFQNSAMQFSVPPFPSDPAPPQQAKVGDDPYQNADTLAAYQTAYDGWQAQLKANHQQLASLRTQVKQWTDRLRALPAPFDNTGADVYGCLQNAADHFKGISGEKILLIASPLINNTTLQETRSISLSGAIVSVIWHNCVPGVASTCQSNDAMWKHILLSDAAQSVTFYDAAQSEVEKPTF